MMPPSSVPATEEPISAGEAAAVRANALTSLKYDVGAYRHSLAESVGPGRYHIGTPTQECQECFSQDPTIRLAASGNAKCIDRPLVDVDSELHGITRKATKDPSGQFLPDNSRSHKCKSRPVTACRDYTVLAEDTRISNPPCTLRGSPNGFNRWEPLCNNPQANVELPFESFINNRLLVKDSHRPVLPTPLDQTPILPPNSRDDTVITSIPQCLEPAPPVYPMAFFQNCAHVY